MGREGAAGRAGAAACGAAVALAASGKAPRSFFTTGASMVDEAERTNSPSSCSFATASFEVIPSSLASSCTRTLATFLLSRSAPSQARTVYFLLIPVAGAIGTSSAERNGLIIVAHSSLGAHRISMRVLTRFQGGRWVGARVSALQVCPEVHCELRSIHRRTEGPVEGSPLDGRFQTRRVGVQPSTPSGQSAPLIDHDHTLCADQPCNDPNDMRLAIPPTAPYAGA